MRKHASEIRRRIRDAGGTEARVFGSVATGRDGPDSDIDLLFAMRAPLGMLALARLEHDISTLLGHPVDLVPESSLRPDVRERILREAVPL
ncbi:MAG: nucleotidyltransferase family protein [Microbacteriaceae bacterium]|nr:nucleotidyltransferase family protein [Microbacteriaceae bacterium]